MCSSFDWVEQTEHRSGGSSLRDCLRRGAGAGGVRAPAGCGRRRGAGAGGRRRWCAVAMGRRPVMAVGRRPVMVMAGGGDGRSAVMGRRPSAGGARLSAVVPGCRRCRLWSDPIVAVSDAGFGAVLAVPARGSAHSWSPGTQNRTRPRRHLTKTAPDLASRARRPTAPAVRDLLLRARRQSERTPPDRASVGQHPARAGTPRTPTERGRIRRRRVNASSGTRRKAHSPESALAGKRTRRKAHSPEPPGLRCASAPSSTGRPASRATSAATPRTGLLRCSPSTPGNWAR